jgi:hypothetical protein
MFRRRTTRPSVCALLALMLGCATRTLAHDPFEITCTVYSRSNRVEVFAEMEYRAAMLLAGADAAALAGRDVATEFQSHLPSLIRAAGGLLALSADNSPLVALRTNVTLEVENHIRFALDYPEANSRTLTASAPGLARIAADGGYGVNLTVLDMVNQKVLGQTVLFADTPSATFAPAPVSTPPPPARQAVTKLAEPVPAVSQVETAAEKEPSPVAVISWPVILCAVVVACLALAWVLLRKSSSNRT